MSASADAAMVPARPAAAKHPRAVRARGGGRKLRRATQPVIPSVAAARTSPQRQRRATDPHVPALREGDLVPPSSPLRVVEVLTPEVTAEAPETLRTTSADLPTECGGSSATPDAGVFLTAVALTPARPNASLAVAQQQKRRRQRRPATKPTISLQAWTAFLDEPDRPPPPVLAPWANPTRGKAWTCHAVRHDEYVLAHNMTHLPMPSPVAHGGDGRATSNLGFGLSGSGDMQGDDHMLRHVGMPSSRQANGDSYMPKNVERLLQQKLHRMRTNKAVRAALASRVTKIQVQRREDAIRRSHGMNVMRRHRMNVTNGHYTKEQAQMRRQERARLRDARMAKTSGQRRERQEARILLRMRRARAARNAAKARKKLMLRRTREWSEVITVVVAYLKWGGLATPGLQANVEAKRQRLAATHLQQFWRRCLRRQLELKRLFATATIHRMMSAKLFRLRLRRADPQSDAAVVLVGFLKQCRTASFIHVMRQFRRKVAQAQRVWRNYQRSTAARLKSLHMRLDELERDNRERIRKQRVKAQDRRPDLLDGPGDLIIPKMPPKLRPAVKHDNLLQALKLARLHFTSYVVPRIKAENLRNRQELLKIGVAEARSLIRANIKGARHIVLKHFHTATLAAKPKPVPFRMWRYFSPLAMHHLMDAMRCSMAPQLITPERAAMVGTLGTTEGILADWVAPANSTASFVPPAPRGVPRHLMGRRKPAPRRRTRVHA